MWAGLQSSSSKPPFDETPPRSACLLTCQANQRRSSIAEKETVSSPVPVVQIYELSGNKAIELRDGRRNFDFDVEIETMLQVGIDMANDLP
jgi:hypothetical protein